MSHQLHDLKQVLHRLFLPVSRMVHHLGITANQMTVANVAISLLTGAFLCCKTSSPRSLLILAPVLVLRGVLISVTGMLAKEFELRNRLGMLLDELGAVVSDSALYLPLALGWHFSAVEIVLLGLLAVMSEMTGVLGLMVGSGRRYDGPMGFRERAVVIGLVTMVIGIGVPVGIWQNVLVGAVDGCIAYTIYNRARMSLWRGQ